MNILLPLLAFSILLLVPIGAQNAAADTVVDIQGAVICQSVKSGIWTDSDVWNCNGSGPGNGPPPVGGEGFVNNGHTVTFTEDVNMDSGSGDGGVKTNPGGSIAVENGVTVQTGFLRNVEGTFELNGDLIVTRVFDNRGSFWITCSGSVVIDPISSSSSSNSATIKNHGSFELKENVLNFQNNGDFKSGGTLTNVVPGENFDGNAISPIPNICTAVGGEFLPIDSTSLVLAGIQSSAIWMLPVLAGIASAGVYLVKFRTNKE